MGSWEGLALILSNFGAGSVGSGSLGPLALTLELYLEVRNGSLELKLNTDGGKTWREGRRV